RAFGEPDSFATHNSPEPDFRHRIDSTRLQGEQIERLGPAELEFANEVHSLDVLLVLDVFLHGFEADASDGRHEVAVRPESRKTGLEPDALPPKVVAGAAL